MRKTDYNLIRQNGIDIARISSMLGILMMHFLGQGGLLSTENMSDSYWLFYLFEIMAFCSVDVFGIISGYLGFGKKQLNSYRVFELCVTILIYSIVITIVGIMLLGGTFLKDTKLFVTSLIPVLGGNEYWYIICYILVLIFSPYINMLLDKISLRDHKRLCIVLVSLFSVVQSMFIKDLFYIRQGYSILWLVGLYILGAYFKRANLYVGFKKSFAIFGLSALILLVLNIGVFYIMGRNVNLFVKYTSPLVLLMAVVFFLAVKGIKIKSAKLSKLLSYFAITSFDVYIIHCHPLVFEKVLKERMSFLLSYSIPTNIVLLFLIILMIYIILSLMGGIKNKLLSWIKLKELWVKVTKDKFSYRLDR